MAIALTPYIHFVDNAQAAIDFYKTVFGAEVEINRFGDFGTPETDPSKDLVMHSALEFAGTKLFISDSKPMGGVKQDGENITLALNGTVEDEAVLTQYFNALGEGGAVNDPLSTKPWGATFGMLVDKFGIHWMVNITKT